MIPEFPCNDCDINTVPLKARREYYEVQDQLWHDAKAPGIGQSDNGVGGFYLCIGCLEARLGRVLSIEDFKNFPANRPSPWLSRRLNARLGQPDVPAGLRRGLQITIFPRNQVAQFFPNDLMSHVKSLYGPNCAEATPTGSYAIGGNCEWPEDSDPFS